MSPVTLSRFVALATVMSAAFLGVTAQGTTSASATTSGSSSVTPAPSTTTPAPAAQSTYPATALAKKGPYQYPNGIPYKVDTDLNLIRGPQIGYNICNSTTESQTSLCQTAWLNGMDDFCLWGPPDYGRSVGDIEGIMVAYCSKPGHGTRLIPAGALTGLQYIKTPDYVQVVGYFDQTQINILKGDYGGEMDPHGADSRGNPMGGIVFSGAFTGSPIQGIEWHNFVGSNKFCMKVCDPNGPNAAHFCEHIYDRIGTEYNCPNAAKDNVFESCEGENQDYPGIYTSNGAVQTYTQPAESLGVITTIPYVARVPASSKCTTFTSANVFTGLPTGTSSTTATTTSSGVTTTTSGTGSTSSSSSAPAATGAASGLKASGIAAFVGVVASIVFLS